jgi:uncharacterized protein
MTTRRWLWIGVAAIAIALLTGRAIAGAYVEYQWYDSLGATALWRARTSALAIMRLCAAAGSGLFAFANLYAVRKSVVSLAFPRRLGNFDFGEEVPGRYLLAATIALSVILAAAIALPQNDWTTFLLARSRGAFGESDPYLGADLGFFVSWIPFENALWTWAFITTAVIGIAVIALYALTPSLRLRRGSLYLSTYVRRHFTVLAGVVLLLLAWSFRLDMYAMLYDGSGPEGAFTWVDHKVGVPGSLLLSVATLGAGLIVVFAGFVGQFRLAVAATLSVVAAALLVREIAPAVATRIGSETERASRENSYIGTRAGYTRRAFGVDAIRTADSSDAFPSLAAALPWVPVWDPAAIARALDGVTGTLDASTPAWHASPNGILAEILEPPPLDAPARAPWVDVHVLAADADDRGAPVRSTAAGTPTSDDTLIDAPIAYPGAPPFAIVPDSLNRLAGTPLGSVLGRLAYAWTLQNVRIVFGDLPQPHPTIVTRRDVRERVERLVPFFMQGRRVEPISLGDSLYWSVDLYAVSATYPLSRHFVAVDTDVSYLRHAAVAVVQAATGETVVVPDSVLDPIGATWARRLPTSFASWTSLPPRLRELLPPQLDAVYAQATAFGRYGTRADSDVPRRIPLVSGADTSLTGGDVPVVLPGTDATSIVLPLLDETDRVRGLFIGTGGVHRSSAWYSLPSAGPRWGWVVDRLRALDSAGNAAREGPLAHGRIRALPMRSGNRLAFIQPTYRWRSQGAPTLNRVVTLVGDTVRTATPDGLPRGAALPQPSRGDLRATIAALYAAMRDALRRGDWVAFGRAFDALGRTAGSRSTP